VDLTDEQWAALTCPTAAVLTANSTRATFAMVMRCLPERTPWYGQPGSPASRDLAGTAGSVAGLVPGLDVPRESDDFDMDLALRVRGEPQDVLVAEQGGPGPDEPA